MLFAMRSFSLRVCLILAVLTTACFAFETGDFIVQGQFALAKPFAPSYVTDYWSSSVSFSGGIGVALPKLFVLFTYSNQALNRKDGFVAEDDNGFAHEVMINLKRFFVKQNSKLLPFFQLSGGYTLLRTPILYKESTFIPGDIENYDRIEDAHAVDGLTVGAGAGVNVELSELSMIYIELYGSTMMVPQNSYPNLGVRAGVLFQLGD